MLHYGGVELLTPLRRHALCLNAPRINKTPCPGFIPGNLTTWQIASKGRKVEWLLVTNILLNWQEKSEVKAVYKLRLWHQSSRWSRHRLLLQVDLLTFEGPFQIVLPRKIRLGFGCLFFSFAWYFVKVVEIILPSAESLLVTSWRWP